MHNNPTTFTNDRSDEQAYQNASTFLKQLQSLSSKLSNFEKELAIISECVARVEQDKRATNFADQLWQLGGHRRFAEKQIMRLRMMLNPALRLYSNQERRDEALVEIQKQIERTESSLRELRQYWRELSATYHFMLGVKGILV